MAREEMSERTRQAILDAAAQVLSAKPEASMAEIATGAHVGRATLYRHFPTRESLVHGVQDAGVIELLEALEAAGLEQLPADRAIARITAVFLRTGAKYAAVVGRGGERTEHPPHDRAIAPVHEVIARGIHDGELRNDLPELVLFAMFDALISRALILTVTGVVPPEQAADSVVAVFLNGASAQAHTPGHLS
ncbi:TetR/AcrR family transcriptional regulator [Mycobacteroides abscessus]|uniref:TetR/AcrR family transcriptional regulator n=1 Tax=Mycobacteroides abscessus TaxID=36809 RepID=UPI0009A61DEB|nr:TetR/AcrR family transcriptional regulator [Mycobacteroides abscessus]SKG48952.1 TetR family transcriptional regulator [Mycobacteroides abscessus subsp. massiliense]SKH53354.1 TetR family transcriptional regulator [Mycobacteroides abscessus subsp. massiliense]SKH96233.1 TetR family transcriptional regulator [Mycobacteroides abscessus subsp. massiliense]SKI92408.1 TetR family transcriptional regulator [Mycobacteroides abscessus subsp. massiliense]SKJ46113.1 TetR family transcriptional regula